MLYTTFAELKKAGACPEGYKKLAVALGGVPKYGRETPIPLDKIVESNGIEDAIWCLCATTENCDRLARLFACDYAEHVLPLYTAKYPDDKRPAQAIAVARRFANGQATEQERTAARDAADDAAEAAEAAPRTAAWTAAWTAGDARDAAWFAARTAARDAERGAAWFAEVKWQTELFLKMLREEHSHD